MPAAAPAKKLDLRSKKARALGLRKSNLPQRGGPPKRVILDPVGFNFHLNRKQPEAFNLLCGPQRHTMLVGGARSGKTFLLIYTVLARAMQCAGSRSAILRLHYNHAKTSIWLDTLPKVCKLCFPAVPISQFGFNFHESDKYVELVNGSQIWVGGLDEKERVERILGQEHSTLYFNECSQIPYASVLMALTRLAQKVDGLRNKAYYDLNPVGTGHWTSRLFLEHKKPDTLESLADSEEYKYLYMNPEDNAENIDEAYLNELKNLPERLRRRFYEGQYIAQLSGALWTLEGIEQNRVAVADVPAMRRVVVAVDPSGASGEFDIKADQIGIVTAGLGVDGHGYVFEDNTGWYSPENWARAACNAYYKYQAERLVAEKNFGGDMVRAIVYGVDPNVSYKEVIASRGKAQRAEPIAALYEQGRIHHVGRFPHLEDEMTNFTNAGYLGSGSPNRCFIAGTLIRTAKGSTPIEHVQIGDLVWTRQGLRPVLACGLSAPIAKVVRLSFSDARTLTLTPDHLVYTNKRGFVRADALLWDDIIEVWPSANESSFKELPISGIQSPRINRSNDTIAGCNEDHGRNFCTGLFGFRYMARYPWATIFTMWMKTHLIIRSTARTTNVLLKSSMHPAIRWLASVRLTMPQCCVELGHWLLSGMDRLPGWPGTKSMVNILGGIGGLCLAEGNALSATKGLRPTSQLGRGFVRLSATRNSAKPLSDISKVGPAQFAERSFLADEVGPRPVPMRVVRSCDAGRHPVYDLQVADTHEFYANGVLVHNCDSLVWALSELFPTGTGHGFLNLIGQEMDVRKYGLSGKPSADNPNLIALDRDKRSGFAKAFDATGWLKRPVNPATQPGAVVVNDPTPGHGEMLAEAQKQEAGFMTGVKKLGKVATTNNPPTTGGCPKCGNKFVSQFADTWKCGACGASGANPK